MSNTPVKEPDNRGPNEITSAIPEQMFARARAPRVLCPFASTNNATPSINSFNRGADRGREKKGARGRAGRGGRMEKKMKSGRKGRRRERAGRSSCPVRGSSDMRGKDSRRALENRCEGEGG